MKEYLCTLYLFHTMGHHVSLSIILSPKGQSDWVFNVTAYKYRTLPSLFRCRTHIRDTLPHQSYDALIIDGPLPTLSVKALGEILEPGLGWF